MIPDDRKNRNESVTANAKRGDVRRSRLGKPRRWQVLDVERTTIRTRPVVNIDLISVKHQDGRGTDLGIFRADEWGRLAQ